MKKLYLVSKYIILSIILISSLLVYPLYLVSYKNYFGSIYLQYFTLSAVSLLAVSLILFNYKYIKLKILKKTELSLSIFVILIISIIQFFIFKSYSLSSFGFSIIWISIPSIVFIYRKQSNVLIPIYFMFIWGIDLTHTYFQTGEKVGIAGNRNWHAIFLLALIIISFYTYKKIFKYLNLRRLYLKIFLYLISSFYISILIYSIWIIYLCNSRGAVLASILSLVVLVTVFLKRKLRKDFTQRRTSNKRIFFSFVILLFFLFILGIFIAYKTELVNESSKNIVNFEEKVALHKNNAFHELEDAFNRDVRVPLWIGTLKLILNHPLIGVGAERFETEFASYRPISYFLKEMSATRTNHPHNIILYILACYGLPGFVFWAMLCIYPILYCFIKFSKLNFFEQCSLFAYFCLFIHACFDLIFYVWPTLFIAMLLLGILWSVVWKSESIKEVENKIFFQNVTKYICYICGFCLLFSTVVSVYNESVGSYNIRRGYYYDMMGKDDLALEFYNRGLNYIAPEKFVYKSGLIAFNTLKNPSLALKYFSLFNFIPTKNYAHNNGFIALGFMQKGDFKAALPYLLKEVINYPLSTGAWYRLSFVQNTLGQKKLAKFSYKNMLSTLKYKNLPPKALRYVLENPEYDKHPQIMSIVQKNLI